tara:strand:- start:667 stop:882 length:216 start_codon:yes stop_codon:yes gene_type:complete
MENINRHVLAQLTQEQQIVYMTMMMDKKQMPMFNQDINPEIVKTGKMIKEMFDDNIYNKMKLDNDGKVVLE